MSRPRAATLAVGTEITDGQILDRNSAWISKKLIDAGLEMVEHRAVADDRAEIESALIDLFSRIDVLFVTGGLGPTSDDFTREVLAKAAGLELEFDAASWSHIEKRFASRGLEAKPIQRQQCYFPKGSRIMTNNAGTANAFSFSVNEVRVFAMPGPPIEIATVWAEHLEDEIQNLTPVSAREEMHLVRTLGTGESVIAEAVEKVIEGSGLRVGYRAHLPYVEVKLWYAASEKMKARLVIDAVETSISRWIVSRGDEDFVDAILMPVQAGRSILVDDRATAGIVLERILERARGSKVDMSKGRLSVTSSLGAGAMPIPGDDFDVRIDIAEREASKSWHLSVKKKGQEVRELEVAATPLYNFGTDRGRKYLTERVFQELASIGL